MPRKSARKRNTRSKRMKNALPRKSVNKMRNVRQKSVPPKKAPSVRASRRKQPSG